MKVSTFILCIWISIAQALWKQINNFIPKFLNPLNLLYTNRCIEDLGCFYTGPPFFHPTIRPISLPPWNVQTRFLLFTPSSPEEEYVLEPTKESLENSTFNPKLKTKFLVHGFLADVDYNDVRFTMKDAMLKRGKVNIIVVDWTAGNQLPYFQAVSNTRVVGAKIARLIHFLVNETGMRPRRFHIIGHSLGAHIAGYAGERVKKIGRITGLDPAGPYYQDEEEPEIRLDPTDAMFVDVIHTDGGGSVYGGLGFPEPLGHMDFYPNGGSLQLGCVYTSSSASVVGRAINFTTKMLPSVCDHSRANAYFLESINNTNCRFLAVRCSSYSDFEQARCPPENFTVAEMGLFAKKLRNLTFPAKFFLRTNGVSPFCNEHSIIL